MNDACIEGRLDLATPPFDTSAGADTQGCRGLGTDGFRIADSCIHTPHALLALDEDGRVVSFLDKHTGREILRTGGRFNAFMIGEDVPRMWDNWNIDADQRLKMREDHRLVRRDVVANGPLQLRIRSEYTIGARSRIVQDMVFHADSPRVDFETRADWAEKHQLLKAGFDLDVFADFARHEIQFGHIERPTHGNHPQDAAKFEVCNHKWTDLSDNGFGVAILNDCKYGISVDGGSVGLSLLKSGTHPDPRADEGRHAFTYSILPHAGAWSVESVVRPAYELNVPVKAHPAGPSSRGFEGILSVGSPNVIVESVKWAEDEEGFVVRLYEAGKIGGSVSIRLNVPVTGVVETNLLEESVRALPVNDGTVTLAFRPFEIKTLVCRR